MTLTSYCLSFSLNNEWCQLLCYSKKNPYVLEMHDEIFKDEIMYLEYASK